MNKSEVQDSIEYNEELTIQDKEKIWSDTFGSEYKPDYNYKDFFSNLKSKRYDSGYGVLYHENQDDIKEFGELYPIIEKNGFKIDINFLESLDDKLKIYISQLFLEIISPNFDRQFKMGGSLLIWMLYWGKARGGICYIDDDIFKQIAKNIKDFNLKYFRQAYDYCIRQCDRNIYHILQEYNLIKNFDNDIASPEITSNLNLGKDFSIGTFHTRSELLSFGYEEKYGLYDLDCNGNEVNFSKEGDKFDTQYDKFVLDRNHESNYKDSSGITYQEYLDSPTGLALFYQGNPIACICFGIRNWNEFFINQIQKIPYGEYDRYGRCIGKRYSQVVNQIDWKKILYNATINLAKKYNISHIVIQGGKNNRWIKENREYYESYYFKNHVKLNVEYLPEKRDEKVIHLDPKIAHQIYDVFAENLGFEKDEDGNREKEI